MRFEGFPGESIQFLSGLQGNNNKMWFEAHRQDYEEYVKAPMFAFIVEAGRAIQQFDPPIVAEPRINGSLYRIYRDTRFSRSKQLYKTHAAAIFWHRDGGKHETAGYYFQFDSRRYMLGGGLYMPTSEGLQLIREYIADHADVWEKVIANRNLKRLFGGIYGETLKRPPRGFNPDHPMIKSIKMKQFLVGLEEQIGKVFHTREFLKETTSAFKAMSPLIRCLNTALRLE